MEIKGKTMLTVPGYDPRERFEFGVMVYFAWEIEGTGTFLPLDPSSLHQLLIPFQS